MAVSNISAVLSADAATEKGAFYTAVFSYGMGLVEILRDMGYKPAGPDQTVRVPLQTDIVGSAEVYSEGDGLPAWVEPEYAVAQFSVKAFRSVIRMTGNERRALGEGGEAGLMSDLQQAKLKAAIDRIKYLIATTYDDDAAYGIQDLIDNSATFGGLSRTTYDKLVSYCLTGSYAAVSTALLNYFWHRSQNDPYGCAFDLILASTTQASRIAEVYSGKVTATSPDAPGGLNFVTTDMRVGTAPIVVVPNLVTSVIFGLTGARVRAQGDAMGGGSVWGLWWAEPSPGRFHVLDLGAGEGDNPMRLQISTALAVGNTQPQRQGKLYALTAA
jgi:hypothetical protein